MKIFNEEEVDKASKGYARKEFERKYPVNKLGLFDERIYIAFNTGVEYAESKVEDLCIEFVEWINSKMDWNFENEYKTYKELFQQFLTQRNEK